MKRAILVIALFLSSVCHAQTDTAFWFAAPHLSRDDRSVRFVFHTYDQSAIVTVEQPANSLFPTRTFAMAAHDVATYDLSTMVDSIETSPINTVLNRGFYIHSTAPITCYYQSTSSNRETYTLKGHNALGTYFDVLTPVPYLDTPYVDIGQSLEIVATENNTLVSITAPNFIDTVRSNDPWWHYNRGSAVFEGDLWPDSTMTILLNRGQSYAVRAKHYDTEIIRTRIHATHPIAVNTTSTTCMSRRLDNDTTHHFNLAGEQLTTTLFQDHRHITIYTNSHSELLRDIREGDAQNYVRTSIRYNNNPQVFWSYDRNRGSHYIHQIDPNLQMGATIIPGLDCAGSHQISYLRSDSMSLTLLMVINSDATGHILFNNSDTVLTPADFQPVPGHPSYSWCAKEVSTYLDSNSVMTVSCSTDKFILAVIESDSNRGTAYTYLTDYAHQVFTDISIDSDYCAGDSIFFSPYLLYYDSLIVHCPNGNTLSTPPYTIPDVDTTMNGIYTVEAFSYNNCYPIVYDTVNIHIYPSARVEFFDTIRDNQIPYHRFNTHFYSETDTIIIRPNPLSPCDSIIHYHLHIDRNIYDTVLYYACEGDLPIRYDDTLLDQEGQSTFHFISSNGEDSLVTFFLHIIPSSDTTICDSITEDQLPWFVYDTVFNDTVADYIYHTYNEAGCVSIILYYLFIFWNGDHCDTALSYPNVVTPNGDGVNDRFVIGGLIEHNCFKYNELTIYDRYGHCVYHKRNIATEDDWWNPAAQRAPSGTYFYYFKAHGVNIWTQHRGVIEVLRDK